MSLEMQEIWAKLSKINVNGHVEKKGKFSYLAWTWGWATLMDNYPQATYVFREPIFFPDGSCEVWCDVTIDAHTRSMWLPVMDYNNKGMPNPSSRDISDARMRCLVKALAMFGLGHYIYAGESVPDGKPDYVLTPETKEKMRVSIASGEKKPEIIIANLEKAAIVSDSIKKEIRGL